MPHPVEDHLRHSALAIDAFARGFVINRLGEAFDRPGATVIVCLKHEFAGRIVDPLRERQRLVGLDRLLDG